MQSIPLIALLMSSSVKKVKNKFKLSVKTFKVSMMPILMSSMFNPTPSPMIKPKLKISVFKQLKVFLRIS